MLAKIYETSIISVLCSLIQHDPVLKRGIHEADRSPGGADSLEWIGALSSPSPSANLAGQLRHVAKADLKGHTRQ